MPITAEKLEERMQKRRRAVGGTGKFISAHGCPETGAGVVITQRPWGSNQTMAYYFKARSFRNFWHSEELKSNHQLLNPLKRLRSLIEAEKAAAIAPHDLKVGEIVADIWGVTMRDVSFFRVTAIPHPRKVTLAKIPSKIISGDWMAGSKVPDKDHPGSDETVTLPVTMKYGTAQVKGSEISNISRWDGKPVSIYSD